MNATLRREHATAEVAAPEQFRARSFCLPLERVPPAIKLMRKSNFGGLCQNAKRARGMERTNSRRSFGHKCLMGSDAEEKPFHPHQPTGVCNILLPGAEETRGASDTIPGILTKYKTHTIKMTVKDLPPKWPPSKMDGWGRQVAIVAPHVNQPQFVARGVGAPLKVV